LAQWRDSLNVRRDKGRFWWELRTCSYYEQLERPKIVYQDIAWDSEFALDVAGLYGNNTTYFLPTGDTWLLAVLNAPLVWWYSWRKAQHAKDEALRFFSPFLQAIPIAVPRDDPRKELAELVVSRLLGLADERVRVRSLVIDWLAVEHEVAKPSRRTDLLSVAPEGAAAQAGEVLL
jgi:restriction endonuclease TaqI-like protein